MLLIQKGQTVTNPPSPPYTEATGPQDEAKPSPFIDLEEALAAATAALRPFATQPYGDVALGPARAAIKVLNAVAPILIAAGRAQAAADIRAHRGSLDGLAWQERAAKIAERGGEADQSKERA
jgi:hypothetical protein